MRKHVIVYTKDDSTGEMGFRLKLMPRLDNGETECGDGTLIAHDLLEHMRGPREIGGIADEVIALGAAWYVRGQWGVVTDPSKPMNRHTNEENIGSDIARMAELWDRGEYFPDPVENLKALPRVEAPLQRIYNAARKFWLGELNYTGENAARVNEMRKAAEENFWPKVLPYLRQGHSAAARRYRGRDVSWFFWQVAREVDKALSWAEYEGQEFVIHMDIARCIVDVHQKVEHDE